MKLNSKRGNPQIAEAVIEELGVAIIQEETKLCPSDKPVSNGAITNYKKYGFPIFFEKYLRMKYKKLSAWTLNITDNVGDVNG